MTRPVPSAAVELIKDFEKLHEVVSPGQLRSYLCAAGVWTIGWGSTRLHGMPVMPGTRCSIAEAEKQFEQDLSDAANVVERLTKVELSDAEFGALVCLVQNIGAANFSRSTLLRRLNSGELPSAVMSVELPRWVKGRNDEVLDGLVRRRQAELALLNINGNADQKTGTIMIRFSDAAKYDKGLARQNDAWRYIYGAAPEEAWDAFQDKLPEAVVAEFAKRFRSGDGTAAPMQQQQSSRILEVPYFGQRDNYRDSDRTCFSSTNAMALKFLKPGAIKTDDDYVRTVFSIGDTTEASVQIKALSSYGVKAVFRQDADFDLVRSQLNKGIPVPLGWVHRGPVSRPRGSGHWSLAIGYTGTGLVVHDPWGEPDLIGGGTLSAKGSRLQMSYKNFGARWMVEPAGDGTYRHAPGKGWCLILG